MTSCHVTTDHLIYDCCNRYWRMKPSSAWKVTIQQLKSRFRPTLERWDQDGFASTRKFDVDQQKILRIPSSKKQLPVVDYATTSRETFVKFYEKASNPCVIKNIPQVDQWRASEAWQFHLLKQRYGKCYFSCGIDQDQKDMLVRLDHFLQYMEHNQDDSPLYLFDTYYELDEETEELLTDYNIPRYFPEDYLSLLPHEICPSYRWFLIGPTRSGSALHYDPLSTSAWNTLLQGKKRWILFPPSLAPASILRGDSSRTKEPIHYFIDYLPDLLRTHPDWEYYEAIQEPGDTVFIPSRWWHAVLNLEHTIAITQVSLFTRTFRVFFY
jgi:histone arginine demethylase JMJD6